MAGRVATGHSKSNCAVVSCSLQTKEPLADIASAPKRSFTLLARRLSQTTSENLDGRAGQHASTFGVARCAMLIAFHFQLRLKDNSASVERTDGFRRSVRSRKGHSVKFDNHLYIERVGASVLHTIQSEPRRWGVLPEQVVCESRVLLLQFLQTPLQHVVRQFHMDAA